jgi:hypothetical protein
MEVKVAQAFSIRCVFPGKKLQKIEIADGP